jgi:hypothetical protein
VRVAVPRWQFRFRDRSASLMFLDLFTFIMTTFIITDKHTIARRWQVEFPSFHNYNIVPGRKGGTVFSNRIPDQRRDVCCVCSLYSAYRGRVSKREKETETERGIRTVLADFISIHIIQSFSFNFSIDERSSECRSVNISLAPERKWRKEY